MAQNNGNQANQEFDINSLLDGMLDDLADLPEFKPFLPGAYRAEVFLKDKASAKKDWIAGHPAYEVKLTIREVVELVEQPKEEKDIPKVGDETGVAYMIDNEYGQGNFKKLLAAASAKFGRKTIRELIEDINSGSVALIVTKLRANKEKTQNYTELVEIEFE